MSATGKEPSLRELVDEVLTLLDDDETELRDEPASPTPPLVRYGRLHEVAAVLDWFDPEAIQPTAGAGELESVEDLLASSTQTLATKGQRHWTLTPAIRVVVLRQLREHGRISDALAASQGQANESRGPLHAYLQGTPVAVEDQSLPQLAASFEAYEWLRSAGFQGLPERDALRQRIDWLTLLEPFEHLAGTFFRGRTVELQRLRSYAEVLAPAAEEGPAPQSAEEATSGKWTPKQPLFIYGPGGVGKSTLLARFILEHAQALERDRFPFAYLDFDRPDVDGSEPLTLLIEAVRQLAIEYPQARERSQRIREKWTEQLLDALPVGTEMRKQAAPSLARARSSAVRDFARLLRSLGASDRPVLFVLDTFEEVQWRSEEDVAAIWTLLEQLQPVINRLRVCIAGRGQLVGHTTEELPLTGLDEEAAVGYLLARGVSDPAVARRIARQVGGSPMSLKLAAELVQKEGQTGELLGIATRESLYVQFDDGVIQRQLYKRVLGRIHNPDVQKIAHPGLVLRRLTPELILETLAVPCGLAIASLDEARVLFEELRREVSLVTVDSDGALVHRPDLRRLMVPLIEEEEPDRVRAIRELAVRYYEPRPAQPRERAEEIYLRLALGEDTAAINPRWIPGVEQYLGTVLPEFSGARRAYLASRLGIEVDEQTRRLADLEDWERLVERKARELLMQQQPGEVLKLLTRDDRTACSPLFALQATALVQLGRAQESLAVLEEGFGRAVAAGSRMQALELAIQQSEVAIASASTDDTTRLSARLERLTEGVVAPADLLNATCHRLALERVAPVPLPHTAELQRKLRELFDGLPDEVLGNNPSLARWVGSLCEVEDIARLSRVLRTSGLPRGDTSALRRLASAIASSDRRHSEEIGASPGFLSAELQIPSEESLTSAWGQYLLTSSDTSVLLTLRRLLDEYQEFVSPEVVEAFTIVFRSALGIERRSSRASRDAMVEFVSRPPTASLTASMVDELHSALLSAFPSSDELREFLQYRLDRSLDAIAPPQESLSSIITALIQVAQAEGWVDKLVVTAREAHPANPALARVADRLGLPTLVPGDPAVIDEVTAARPGAISPTRFRERLGAIEGQVCQVEVAGRVSGTGFLVGPDLVLTANHLLGSVLEGGRPLREVVLRFDHKADRTGRAINPGTEFELEEVLARSEYSERPGQLGYALLRVAGHPGTQPIGDLRTEATGRLREWIDMPDPPAPIGPGDGLVMVQHPREKPLTLTVNSQAVVSLPDGDRVLYDLAAEPGSSGAPCFTLDLELVAVHIGLPAPGHHLGVLMSAVRRDLERRDVGHLIGQMLA